MRRLLVLAWLALSLAFASGPAFAVSGSKCPMPAASSHSAMPNDMHGGCTKSDCTVNCATAGPATVMPSASPVSAPPQPLVGRLVAAPTLALRSTILSGADPPPRTIFS